MCTPLGQCLPRPSWGGDLGPQVLSAGMQARAAPRKGPRLRDQRDRGQGTRALREQRCVRPAPLVQARGAGVRCQGPGVSLGLGGQERQVAEGGPRLPVPEPCLLSRALLAPEQAARPARSSSEGPAPSMHSGHSS